MESTNAILIYLIDLICFAHLVHHFLHVSIFRHYWAKKPENDYAYLYLYVYMYVATMIMLEYDLLHSNGALLILNYGSLDKIII